MTIKHSIFALRLIVFAYSHADELNYFLDFCTMNHFLHLPIHPQKAFLDLGDLADFPLNPHCVMTILNGGEMAQNSELEKIVSQRVEVFFILGNDMVYWCQRILFQKLVSLFSPKGHFCFSVHLAHTCDCITAGALFLARDRFPWVAVLNDSLS